MVASSQNWTNSENKTSASNDILGAEVGKTEQSYIDSSGSSSYSSTKYNGGAIMNNYAFSDTSNSRLNKRRGIPGSMFESAPERYTDTSRTHSTYSDTGGVSMVNGGNGMDISGNLGEAQNSSFFHPNFTMNSASAYEPVNQSSRNNVVDPYHALQHNAAADQSVVYSKNKSDAQSAHLRGRMRKATQPVQIRTMSTTSEDHFQPVLRQEYASREWNESQDAYGRRYWWNSVTRESHWYNPDVVERGMMMLKNNIPVSSDIQVHLNMYHTEMRALKNSTVDSASRNRSTADSSWTRKELEIGNRINGLHGVYVDPYVEEQRLAEAAEERKIREAKEEAERLERYKTAKASIKLFCTALLRKYLDSIGYSESIVTMQAIEEACAEAEPGVDNDRGNDGFVLAARAAIEFYDRRKKAQARKQEKKETSLMEANDFNALSFSSEHDGFQDEKAKAAYEAELLNREFKEFFRYRTTMKNFKKSVPESFLNNGEKPAVLKLDRPKASLSVVGNRDKRVTRGTNLGAMKAKSSVKLDASYSDAAAVEGLLPVNLSKKVRKPRAAYTIFSVETMKLVRTETPDVSFRDLQKLVAQKWRGMDVESKMPYEIQAGDDRERYFKELDAAVNTENANKAHNESLLREKNERQQLIAQAKVESREAVETARQVGCIPTGRLPCPQYSDLCNAAIIALGPRSGVDVSKISHWLQSTRLGRLLLGRLRSKFDDSIIAKTLRKFLSRGSQYEQDSFMRRGRSLQGVKMRTEAFQSISDSVPFHERDSTDGKGVESSRKSDGSPNTDIVEKHREDMKAAIFAGNQRKWAFIYRNRAAIEPFVSRNVMVKVNYAADLLRRKGFGYLLEEDPTGYEQEDKALEDLKRKNSPKLVDSVNDENNGTHIVEPSPGTDDVDVSDEGTESKLTEAELHNRRKRPTISQPSCITGGEMRGYQLEGLRWLLQTFENGVSAILADEMGLGKTVQTVAFISYLKFELNLCGPFLIIVPLSVLTAWANEFAKWSPGIRVIKLHSSSKDERERLKKDTLRDFRKYDVVLTTFEVVISNNMKYMLSSKMWWRYVVIDEGHKIKNDETDLSVTVRSLRCQGRLLLTGTPLQNNLHELWSLLNYLYPNVFDDATPFDNCFDLAKHIVKEEMLAKAHYLIRPFVLRRTKIEVEQGMPPKEEIEVRVPLSPMQKYWYKMLLLKDARLLERLAGHSERLAVPKLASESGDWKKLQSLMMQLRKCCNHPYLFPSAEPEFDGSTSEDIVNASGKLKILDRMLSRLRRGGHRVVIFSQFTASLDILQDYLNLRGYQFSRLDGTTNRVQRAIDIMQYNKEDSEYFVYLMSTRAGGLGINLATADTVVLYDSDWNPQVDLQAMDRVHRIGQVKPVHVYRLVASGTVEERVVERAKRKLYLDKMVNRGSTSQAEALESLSTVEMLKMLTFGASSVVEGDHVDDDEDTDQGIPDEQLDQIMNRNRLKGKDQGEVLFSSLGATTKMDDDDSDSSQETKSEKSSSVLSKLSTFSFDKDQSLTSIRTLDGVEYPAQKGRKRKRKSHELLLADGTTSSSDDNPRKGPLGLRDIAASWKALKVRNPEKPKKSVTTLTVARDGDPKIIRIKSPTKPVNNKEVDAVRSAGPRMPRGRQIAGRDYDNEAHCLNCWDGGDLILCDQCCASYHAHCLTAEQLPVKKTSQNGAISWGCPHHSCKICKRKAHVSGGLLFRCTECPTAYCEDHLPIEGISLNENGRELRFEELGQRKPAQAYFFQCQPQCVRFAQTRKERGVMAAIKDSRKIVIKKKRTSSKSSA